MQGEWVVEPQYFKPSAEPRPTLVFLHGGGWVQAAKATRLNYLLPYLMQGYNVVNVEYRKGFGTAPQAALDALLALRYLQDRA